MTARAMFGAAVLGGLACAERPAAAPPGQNATSLAPPESLVATTAGGTEIWFTLARHDSSGEAACTSRTIEIRRGAAHLPVPLLYTSTIPEIVDDTTLRARLSNGCRPGDSYLVDLRTGRPVRERK